MSAVSMDVKTQVILLALKHPNGPEKAMEALKAQLVSASIGGNKVDFVFLVDAAKLLPDIRTATRFLKLTGMMRKKVENAIAIADAMETPPTGPNVLKEMSEILDEADREAKSGFREDELAEAELALEVMES